MTAKERFCAFLYTLCLFGIGITACGMMAYIIAHGGGGFSSSSIVDEPDNEPVEVCGSTTIQIPPAVGGEDECLSPKQKAWLRQYESLHQ